MRAVRPIPLFDGNTCWSGLGLGPLCILRSLLLPLAPACCFFFVVVGPCAARARGQKTHFIFFPPHNCSSFCSLLPLTHQRRKKTTSVVHSIFYCGHEIPFPSSLVTVLHSLESIGRPACVPAFACLPEKYWCHACGVPCSSWGGDFREGKHCKIDDKKKATYKRLLQRRPHCNDCEG